MASRTPRLRRAFICFHSFRHRIFCDTHVLHCDGGGGSWSVYTHETARDFSVRNNNNGIDEDEMRVSVIACDARYTEFRPLGSATMSLGCISNP